MTDQSQSPEMERARDLGQRIRAQIEHLRKHGALSDPNATDLQQAEDRCAGIDRKLEEALARGDLARMSALEAERDYSGLQIELARWIDQLVVKR